MKILAIGVFLFLALMGLVMAFRPKRPAQPLQQPEADPYAYRRVGIHPALAQELAQQIIDDMIEKKLSRGGRGGTQGAMRGPNEDDGPDPELPH